LREPVSAADRADICILTRSDRTDIESAAFLQKSIEQLGIPCFKTIHKPVYREISLSGDSGETDSVVLKDKNVFVFSGIAQNNDFIKTVKSCMCNIKGSRLFSDHHIYSEQDLDGINFSAIENNAEFILTTQKDYVKIKWYDRWKRDIGIFDVDIAFTENKNDFIHTLEEKIRTLI
jgi:tetraacyldisaccharide 4'-kinase